MIEKDFVKNGKWIAKRGMHGPIEYEHKRPGQFVNKVASTIWA